MRLNGFVALLLFCSSLATTGTAFVPNSFCGPTTTTTTTSAGRTATSSFSTRLFGLTIGLGPEQEEKTQLEQMEELMNRTDYEIPDHEAYRTSRRTKLDEECDDWFANLLANDNDENDDDENGLLGSLPSIMKEKLLTPVELKNEMPLPTDHPEYTPYVNTKLPWTPLVPAFGLEQFGIPIPRRNAETWRQFDVAGMVRTDYSGQPTETGTDLELSDQEVTEYQEMMVSKGGWLDDDQVEARLVYVNGRFAPQLSKTTDHARNLVKEDLEDEVILQRLGRLTDGFTDEMAAPIPSGQDELTSFSKLSKPNHNMGDPTSQFAINTQLGTACFAALNTIKTGAVALIRQPTRNSDDNDDDETTIKPVLVVNAITKDGGASSSLDAGKGVAMHPRTLVIAEDNSRLSFVQSTVDLDVGEDRPKLYNGYTQIFVGANANVTHSYLEESGGVVTKGVEQRDSEVEEGAVRPREVEAQRPALKNTHLEALDAHIVGDGGSYECTLLSVGGSGRIRIAQSVTLLRPGSDTELNGFSLCGGAQKSDIKTNIHHCAQGTNSKQLHKTMVGGRGQGSFRGRIRVEQSAQQTESNQLSRTVLLTDRCRAYAIPSLEIIADDVQCAHGATVSDLSEEELFYLRARGLDQQMGRNLLMFAFAGEITKYVEPSMRGQVDGNKGIQSRVVRRLENLVPQGERAIRGDFQSA